MIGITDAKIFWADAPKDGFQKVVDVDVPFKAEGCLHVQATLKIAFFKVGSLKLCFCLH